MKKIGILGGTFDPFHNGHMSIGVESIREVGLDLLILLPANISPFKVNREMELEEHRINMLEKFISAHPHFKLSKIEIDTDTVSYTYDTMQRLHSIYKDDKLYFICGSDALMTVDSWYKGKELLRSTAFIVANRPGFSLDSLKSKIQHYQDVYGSEIFLLSNPPLNISSTDIKKKLKYGRSIRDMVPKEIEKYIDEYSLYR